MKRILYGLSTLAITASPLLTVVACSSDETTGVKYSNENGNVTLTVTLSSSLVSNGRWKEEPTVNSEIIKSIYSLVSSNSDDVRDANSVNFEITSSGYGVQTINGGALSPWATAPESQLLDKIVEVLLNINLPANGGDSAGGGGAGISENRYDFDYGSLNPDSTNRPEAIADLKALVPGYYDSLSNTATGDALFKELQSIQEQHRNNVGSYGQLWEHYKESFTDEWDENDGSIWDIYSEIPNASHGNDPQGGNRPYTPGDDQDSGTGSGEGAAYNREHVIPQSYFNSNGSESQGIKNDPHFTLPSDKSVNSSRSNNNFGEATSISNKTDQSRLAASQSGESVNGGGRGTSTLDSSQTIFEPVDWFKGDIARSHFYFLVTWTSSSSFVGDTSKEFDTFMSKADMQYPYFSTNDHADMFREWNMNDPVDKYNVDVNNSLAASSIAHSSAGGHFELRNPFVDMPELAELIWGNF